MSAAPPRATIFLITYNQERFVRDAVRSVLEQGYPNLQVILSDDCSQDATFDIMRDEAATFRGVHDVVVRQPPRNLGLVPHVFEVAGLADGELLVCAEGDDVAYPNRVSKCVEEWLKTGADALVSNWDVIDESGKLIRRGRQPGIRDLAFDEYFGSEVTPLTGATAAYSSDTFRNVPPPKEPVFAEDLFLTLMLHWRGRKVVWIDEPLVAYRMHEEAATHSDFVGRSLLDQERLIALQSRRNASALRLFERMTREARGDNGWGAPVELNRAAILSDVAFNEFRSTWLEASAAERLRAFLRFREPGQRRWLLPRLLGFGGLSLLKRARAGFRPARSS